MLEQAIVKDIADLWSFDAETFVFRLLYASADKTAQKLPLNAHSGGLSRASLQDAWMSLWVQHWWKKSIRSAMLSAGNWYLSSRKYFPALKTRKTANPNGKDETVYCFVQVALSPS